MLVRKGEENVVFRPVRNGNGDIRVANMFGLEETDGRCHLVAELTFQPGESTGLHDHTNDIEVMYMIEGELVCLEDDGKEYLLKAGDITCTAKGNTHYAINKSDKPAKVLAVVIA